MNRTVKIIELLNKISKGEEAPKKIKFNSTEYKYDKGFNDYYSLDVPITSLLDNDNDNLKYFLNDTVEIIEEPEEKEIEKLDNVNLFTEISNGDWNKKQFDELCDNFTRHELATQQCVKKINELVKAVNELRKEK